METTKDVIEPLIERAEEYAKTSIELLKLNTVDKTSAVVSTLISRGSAVLVLAMFTVMINIGIALWLGDLLGKTYYGFFCVSVFYLVIGSILYFFLHNTIKKKISNSIITQLLN
ncbi:MAG: hypothetical protein K0S44_692 [Bacteroidetes bacterium]|jgi:hypothetical protein|nr:hypothetical protein [Bacteroidota bacterium]